MTKVFEKALVRLFAKFSGGLKVDLGRSDLDMAKVSSEGGQKRLDVVALAVAGEKPVAGEAVPQVVAEDLGNPFRPAGHTASEPAGTSEQRQNGTAGAPYG